MILALASVILISFGIGMRTADAATVEDVNVTVSVAEDLVKTTETVNGQSTTAFGCENWGGFAKVFTLDKAYDVSEIAATNKGAVSFYIYIPDATVLEKYQYSSSYSLDVCSDFNFNDTNKYCFALQQEFGWLNVGWNRIIVSFESAPEKKSIDWTTVSTLRINCVASGISAGHTVKFALFSFTTTDSIPERTVETATLSSGEIMEFSAQEDMAKNSETLLGKEVITYGQVGLNWADNAKVLTLKYSYDASALVNAGNCALSFYFYVDNDATLEAYKATTSYSLDICSSNTYSDAHRYNFDISKLFDGLKVGWNQIYLPLDIADQKNAMDWSTLRYIRINSSGANFAVGSNEYKVCSFALETTTYTAGTVINIENPDYDPNLNPISEMVIIDCDSVSGLVFSGNRIDKEDFRYSTGCVYTSGNGYALIATDLEVGQTDLLKNTIVLAFWIWVEDVDLFAPEAVSSQIEIASSNSFDTNELYWEKSVWTAQLQNDGWNWIVLYGKQAGSIGGSINLNNICRFRIYVNGIASSTLKIDRITIGHVDNTALATAPDWESEKASSGIFKGPNALPSENSGYIGVDFSEAEGYTVVEVTEIEVGCGSTLSTNNGLFVLLCCLLCVGCVIVARKKSKD